jgi:uncharacterized membrane protein YfcA
MTTETHERDDQVQPRKSAWTALAAAVAGSVAGVLLAQAVRLQYAPRLVGWVVVSVAGLWLVSFAADRFRRRAR